jgi:hypothetical protein
MLAAVGCGVRLVAAEQDRHGGLGWPRLNIRESLIGGVWLRVNSSAAMFDRDSTPERSTRRQHHHQRSSSGLTRAFTHQTRGSDRNRLSATTRHSDTSSCGPTPALTRRIRTITVVRIGRGTRRSSGASVLLSCFVPSSVYLPAPYG